MTSLSSIENRHILFEVINDETLVEIPFRLQEPYFTMLNQEFETSSLEIGP